MGAWNRRLIASTLDKLLRSERYGCVFTLRPEPGTHGHHQAVTLPALEAVARLPEDARPAVLGGEPAQAAEPDRIFRGHGVAAVAESAPVFRFSRATRLRQNAALSYQIVVNWMIAGHNHDEERFWLFAGGRESALAETRALFDALNDRTATRSAPVSAG